MAQKTLIYRVMNLTAEKTRPRLTVIKLLKNKYNQIYHSQVLLCDNGRDDITKHATTT